VTSLVSVTALITLFGAGFAATAGRHLSHAYLAVVATALALIVSVLALTFLAGSHPALAERIARWAARLARRVRRGIDPEAVAQNSQRLVSLTRSALTGWAFWQSFGFAAADLLLDLLSLDLMFVAFKYQPGFGPLAVAYAVANIASAIPVTPDGLGVVEVTLVAITVGYGAPRPTAVLAVLSYRLVNYWLPLPAGAVAYLRTRLGPRNSRGPGSHLASYRMNMPDQCHAGAAVQHHCFLCGDVTGDVREVRVGGRDAPAAPRGRRRGGGWRSGRAAPAAGWRTAGAGLAPPTRRRFPRAPVRGR
jgi:Lysylphosphatidylglycerol synthase TM region